MKNESDASSCVIIALYNEGRMEKEKEGSSNNSHITHYPNTFYIVFVSLLISNAEILRRKEKKAKWKLQDGGDDDDDVCMCMLATDWLLKVLNY